MFVIWSEKGKDGLIRFSSSDIFKTEHEHTFMIYEQACGSDWTGTMKLMALGNGDGNHKIWQKLRWLGSK